MSEQPQKPAGSFLHPMSGGLLLLVDNIFFGANALTGGMATPVSSALAFLVTGCGVYSIQRNRSLDPVGTSLVKALGAGLVAGIPTSISGTALGALVLLLSGLDGSKRQ